MVIQHIFDSFVNRGSCVFQREVYNYCFWTGQNRARQWLGWRREKKKKKKRTKAYKCGVVNTQLENKKSK